MQKTRDAIATMIPDRLLNLACLEFATYGRAVEASGNNAGILDWMDYTPQDAYYFDPAVTPEEISKYKRRYIRVMQLPSGFWGWVPDHPDDLATVAEHKRQNSREFGDTHFIQEQCVVPSIESGADEILADMLGAALHKLGRVLLRNFRAGKVYRTKLLIQKGRRMEFGTIGSILAATVMFAPEVGETQKPLGEEQKQLR